MIDTLSSAAGVVVIVVVASDIFRSLLVPRASSRRFRLGPILTAALFPLWQAIADRVPNADARQPLRASLAPLMLVLSLFIWAALLIFGFALIFWSERAGFESRLSGFPDALYAAGLAFTTLGGADIVSDDSARLTIVACGLAGFATVTVVATFLISIQSGFGRRETLVLRLEAHVTLPPTGTAILETYAREHIVERLGPFFDAWETWAAEVAISHRAFPVLIFFRSNDSRCEWLTALGAVLDAAALLDTVLAEVPPSARAASHFVERTGSRLLDDLGRQLGAVPSPEPVDIARFAADCERLAKAGYILVDDRQAALGCFAEARRRFAPMLAALSKRLHIEVEDTIRR